MRMRTRMRTSLSFVILIYIDLFNDSFFIFCFFLLFSLYNIKKSYYWFNRQEIYKKQKKVTLKKAAEYYKQNKEVIKEKSRNCYKNLSEEEKKKIKMYQKKKYQELIQYKKEALKKHINKFVCR